MSLLTRTDVTCVKIFNNYILTGIGSTIEIFDKDSNNLIQKINVLNGQKVYGIEVLKNKSRFLIFGGKQFSTIETRFDNDNEIVLYTKNAPVVCNDWLHSGTWISEEQVALLTAHNVVQIWNTQNQTLVKQYTSKENSILYSGLVLPLEDDVLVFSGTVFSEVIIHGCSLDMPLHHLEGHKGVIFSVSYSPEKEIIVTTSDDRSVRIWTIDNINHDQYDTIAYWKNVKISCAHKLYGHTARVMQSHISNDFIISIGEDSRICFWSHQGKLLRQILSHQNACIWSLDVDNKHLVTGGGDCAVIYHPLSVVSEYGQKDKLQININKPKKVAFTARQNIIIINEQNALIYYDTHLNRDLLYNLEHTSTYKLLSLSSCKQIIAVSDMNGKLDIFIENCKGDAVLSKVIDTNLNLGKILSMHWAGNRHLIVCSEGGIITVIANKENGVEIVEEFNLPQSKERWLTSCDLSLDRNILVTSDRCGHVHIYFRGIKNPVKTFNRVYDRYGATSIIVKNKEFITTGRDGTIKYFSLGKTAAQIKYKTCVNLDFQWLEKFLDNNEKYICGFHERTFVVYDKNNMKVLEMPCGGGHRSWDAIRYIKKVDNDFEEFIKVVYVKNSTLHSEMFRLSKIMSKNIIDGTHSKEINCLKSYTTDNKSKMIFSGGEDTTLRISSSDYLKFTDEVIFKHLSSIRTLKVISLEKNKVLLVSAGGRAQICVKIITIENNQVHTQEIIDYLIKGTDKERKGNKTWKDCTVDFDPETRIMDLEIIRIDDDNFKIITACSDAILRIFNINIENGAINPSQELQFHKTCILKTHVFEFQNKTILITCTTRSVVAFWDFRLEMDEPIFTMKTNKSGINSIDVNIFDDTKFILATAGDDNAIHLNLIEIENEDFNAIKVIDSWSSDKYHCSQITGLKLTENLMISTSIDQRITMFLISVDDGLKCEFVSQYFSDVSDIHGLDVIEDSEDSITVCVFGKGLEILQLPKPQR